MKSTGWFIAAAFFWAFMAGFRMWQFAQNRTPIDLGKGITFALISIIGMMCAIYFKMK